MPGASLRLFIAAYPPPELAAQLLAEVDRIPLPAHRRTPVHQVHLTVLFLGERSLRELPDLEHSVRAAASGIRPIELPLDRLLALPAHGPARTISAIGEAASPLLELHRRLAGRLVSPKRRAERFLPHLTLARFPGSGSVLSVREWPLPAPLVLGIASISVMSSVLAPSGAVHRPLFTTALA